MKTFTLSSALARGTVYVTRFSNKINFSFIMKRIFLTISVLLVAVTIFAQEKNFIDQNYIEITARAEREVAPDEIFLNIKINEKDNKGKASLEKQEKDLFKRLSSLGIDLKEDLQIMDISTLLQKYLLKRDVVITSKSYLLKVHSTEMLIRVFQELESLSIPEVSIEKTSLSNMDEVRQEVMVMAAKSAKQSAEALAKSLDRKLGNAIFIQSYDNYPRLFKSTAAVRGTANLEMESEDAFTAPALDFEKIKFEQSVLIRFSLE